MVTQLRICYCMPQINDCMRAVDEGKYTGACTVF